MRRQKLKHTWQLTPRLLQIIDGRLLTGSTNLIKTVVEVTSGKSHAMALINVRISAHDFSVKLSSCICSHTDSSCPGCWLMSYLDIYLGMTNPALCNDKLVLLAQARPVMINHHTSVCSVFV